LVLVLISVIELGADAEEQTSCYDSKLHV
jgi:hypothetical protein